MNKYYAIPKASDGVWLGVWLKSDSYNKILKRAESELLNNPCVHSYQIMEYVALVSCDVNVSVECFDNDDNEKYK